jgi:Uncharacterised nucleotidyltransferase
VAFESGEEKLLLACIRWGLGVVPLSGIAKFADGVDSWTGFLELAAAHGLEPIAADCLNRSGAVVPPYVAEILRKALRNNAKRVFLLTHELVKLTKMLEAASVTVVALKGPVVAHAYYAEPAHRMMSDLDLLVRPADQERAIRVLEAAGYTEDGDEHLRACRDAFRGWFHEIGFHHPTGPLRVDLHCDLMPAGFPGRLNRDELMHRAQQAMVEGHPIKSLVPEDNLLFLCAHGGKHEWSDLNWIVDICALIRRSSCLPLSRVQGAGLERMVWIGLLLAEFFLEGSVKDLTNLCRKAPTAARRSAMTFLARFGTRGAVVDRPSIRLRNIYLISGTPRLWAAFVLTKIVGPNTADWNSVPIPWRTLFFLYYPCRLARLAWSLRPRVARSPQRIT